MEHILNLGSWLKITLASFFVGVGNCLKLEICFENQSDRPQKLLFSNRSRKAELLSLHFIDELGNMLLPERREVILLKSNSIDEFIITPQGHWLYSLDGKIEGDYLEFQGAAYRVERGKKIKCYFEFAGVKSESIIIDMPA